MRRANEAAGQDLVEFALIAPILFAVLFGIMEFGVAVWRYNTLANTARETAREFVVYSRDQRDPTVVTNYARDYANSVGLPITADNVEYGEIPLRITGDTGVFTYTPLAVTVSYSHQTITGLFGPVPMQARASMLAEGER